MGIGTQRLKNQVVDSLIGPPHADDELPEFGSSFASSAVSNAIDEEVRPDKLGTLVDHLMPTPQPGAHVGLYAMLRGVHMHFTHPGVFEASMVMRGTRMKRPCGCRCASMPSNGRSTTSTCRPRAPTRWWRHRPARCHNR